MYVALSGHESFRILILSILKPKNPRISRICLLSSKTFREKGIGKAYGNHTSFGLKFGYAECKPESLSSRETHRVKQIADAAGEIKRYALF